MPDLPIQRYIDHAVLKPGMTQAEAKAEIQLGIDLQVRTVCVRSADLEMAMDMCAGTETDVCAVLGFPHGVALPLVKTHEAEVYCELGLKEVDMVANYGLIRSHEWSRVKADIHAVSSVLHPEGITLKVILETSELTPEEIAKATECAIAAKADFVKTSTGFASGGATEEAVQIMLDTAKGRAKVKASGGIRDRATAEKYLAMGCSRLGIGSSSVEAIVKGTSPSAATDSSDY